MMSGAWPPPAPSVWYAWIVRPAIAASVSSTKPASLSVSVWIATCTPVASATRRQASIAAGRGAPVLVQLEAARRRPRSCSHSASCGDGVALAEQRDVDRPGSSASSIRARCQAPGVTVVALVPSAGPVPPPMIVVMPAASASSTICGQIRWTWQSIAPAVRILPLPAMISVDGPMTRSGWTPSMVSGLPALPMPTMRPSRMPMSALTMPQWSRIDRAGDDDVGRALGAGRAATGPSTRGSPCRRRTRPRRRRRSGPRSTSIEQVGVGQPDPVAGGRAVQVRRSAARSSSSGSAVERTGRPRRAGRGRSRRAGERHQRRPSRSMPGLEAHRRAGRDVEPLAPAPPRGRTPAPGWPRRSGSASRPGPGRSPVFDDGQRRAPRRPALMLDRRRRRRGSRRGSRGAVMTIGSWTVTSLVPSGKVASTCTSCEHLGHALHARRRG